MLVRYVDGTELVVTPDAWADIWSDVRADGVDYVDLRVAEGVAYRVQGRSIYWLYQQADGRWVVGGGTVASDEPIVEAVADAAGFEVRHPEFMPDLEHSRVKLGWWD